jgi:hypothetical protein
MIRYKHPRKGTEMKGREGMISIEHTKYSTYPIFG